MRKRVSESDRVYRTWDTMDCPRTWSDQRIIQCITKDNDHFEDPKVLRKNGKIRIGAQCPQNLDTHVAFAFNKKGEVMPITLTLEGARPKKELVQRPAEKRAISTPSRQAREEHNSAAPTVTRVVATPAAAGDMDTSDMKGATQVVASGIAGWDTDGFADPDLDQDDQKLRPGGRRHLTGPVRTLHASARQVSFDGGGPGRLNGAA